MSLIKSQGIISTATISLIISIISTYLFILKIINIWILIGILVIFIGSVLYSVYKEIEIELENQKIEQKN